MCSAALPPEPTTISPSPSISPSCSPGLTAFCAASSGTSRQTKVLLRPSEDLSSFEFAGRRIDFETLELTALGRTVRLTLMEADLLRYLVRNQGRIISRKEILERVWRVHEDTDTRAIDNFIVRLRRYIEDEPSEPRYLKTVRGVGYRFLASGD